MYQRSLYIFRQDLRIHDNHALYQSNIQSKEIMPIFIFDETILTNCPKQDQRLGFLIDACRQLDNALHKVGSRLYVYKGIPEQIIPELIKKHNCQAVFHNKSYGPKSQTRDKYIQQRCIQNDKTYQVYEDYLLIQPHEVEQRKVFTPFYNLRKKQVANKYKEIATDKKIIGYPDIGQIHTPHIQHDNEHIYKTIDAGANIYRPIQQAIQRMQTFNLQEYEQTRNNGDIDGTTRLSPYMRFGIVSIRELLNRGLQVHIHKHGSKAGEQKNHYIAELARREFWYHIMYYFPETQAVEFQEKRRHIQRGHNQEVYQKRQDGQTGYPIVDAAMRQLKQENWMHGRARMIVASFLTKDMLIDRRLGEQHFAQYLLDYDHAVNIGNRQRSASVGADPKPLRIFNPILQSQRFDPHAIYIKKYIPELQHIPVEHLHDPLTHTLPYHTPIVNHYTNSALAKKMYTKH